MRSSVDQSTEVEFTHLLRHRRTNRRKRGIRGRRGNSDLDEPFFGSNSPLAILVGTYQCGFGTIQLMLAVNSDVASPIKRMVKRFMGIQLMLAVNSDVACLFAPIAARLSKVAVSPSMTAIL